MGRKKKPTFGLNGTQRRALRGLVPQVWYHAYEIGANERTLAQLVQLGFLIAARMNGRLKWRVQTAQREAFSLLGEQPEETESDERSESL